MREALTLVRVVWVDSATKSGWNLVEDMKPPHAYLIFTIGWLVAESGDAIQVSSTYATDPEQWCDALTIPKVAIRKFDRVREDRMEEEDEYGEAARRDHSDGRDGRRKRGRDRERAR